MLFNKNRLNNWVPFSTIRSKLLLSFSVFTGIIGLIMVFFLGYDYKNERIALITDKLNVIQAQVQSTSVLSRDFFLYETTNQSFYETTRSDISDSQRAYFEQIRLNLDTLKNSPELQNQAITKSIEHVKSQIVKLEKLFDQLVQLIHLRGFKSFGLMGEMRKFIHEVEAHKNELNWSNILMVRRHEKDFLIRKEKIYITRLISAVDVLRQEVEKKITNPTTRQELIFLLDAYIETFAQLEEVEGRIGFHNNSGLKGQLSALSADINQDISKISDLILKRATNIRYNLKLIFLGLFIMTLILVAISGYFVAQKLGKPIQQLSDSIYQVIASNFSSEAQISPRKQMDEVGKLARDFSYMHTQVIEYGEKLRHQTEEVATQRDLLETQNKKIIEAQSNIELANERLRGINENLEKIVAERTEELSKTNEELDTFIYRASHDLKGPIARILGLVQLGHIETQDDQAIQYFKRLLTNVQEMDFVLDKLLMINYLNKGVRRYSRVTFSDIWNCVDQALNHLIAYHKVELSVDIMYDKPFFSDQELLTVILQNLVENAIIFHDPDLAKPPCIRVQLASEGNQFIIAVEDNGIGIPSEYHEKIYNMFFRASELSKGSGLGLYITHKAVQALDGDICVQSQIGKYTRFSIDLPHRNPNKKVIVY